VARTFGGLIFAGPSNIELPVAETGVAAGTAGIVRNATGDVSINNVAGVATYHLLFDINSIKRPYITFPVSIGGGTIPLSTEFQELFGTAAGGPGNPMSGGQLPVTGVQFGTPFLPWGLAIIDVFAVYSVQTAGLTTATIGLNRNVFVENTATVNTPVLAATATALTTTTSATTPHVQKVTLAQPLIYESNDFSNITIEFLVVTAATSALRVYGIGAHVAVEYA
jgi:hypothetical protein